MPAASTTTGADTTFIPSGSLAFLSPATILRCRGLIQISFSSVGLVAGDETRLGFGLAVVSTDAVAAGAGSLPDPLGEPEYPWLWWKEINMFSITTLDIGGTGSPLEFRQEVDSKAMRKVKPGESLTWIGQVASVSGTPAMRVRVAQTRVLIGQ